MKSKLQLLSLVAVTVTLCGCAGNKTLGPNVTRIAVQTAAYYGQRQNPEIAPYLQASAPVICASAGSQILDPQRVTDAIMASNADRFKTPEALLVMNGILSIYQAVYDSFGTNVQASVVQPYLQAVCDGLTSALPRVSNVEHNVVVFESPKMANRMLR